MTAAGPGPDPGPDPGIPDDRDGLPGPGDLESLDGLSGFAAPPPSGLRIAVGLLLIALLYPALVFGSAGTLDWPVAWVWVVMAILATITAYLAVYRRNPDTLAERSRGTKAPGMAGWDRWLVRVVAYGPIVVIVTAGLDHRYHASSFAAPVLQWIALPLAALGYWVAGWAMAENRFFSAVARIQDDRGHRVVDTGPYHWLRHPGYAGSLLVTAVVPLILDSAWALIPAVITMVGLVVRTALEDAMLRARLPGYADYAARTHHRLIPGLW
jgi:protein-S-isoprenylcysteine O-methyltransferase Ste14